MGDGGAGHRSPVWVPGGRAGVLEGAGSSEQAQVWLSFSIETSKKDILVALFWINLWMIQTNEDCPVLFMDNILCMYVHAALRKPGRSCRSSSR